MVHYLIEFRFHGKAKSELKTLIEEVNRKFKIRSKRVVPHITLAGPLCTNNEERLIRDFNRLCSKSPLATFEIDGFSTFEDSRVVFLNVKPSKELDEFRWNLAQTINSYCDLKPFDFEKKFEFHATIAMKLPEDKFSKIKYSIKKKPKINFKHVMVRATLLKGKFILREYDFFLRRSLTRRLAKDKRVYSQTLELLKAHFESKFNPEEFIDTSIRTQKKTFLSKIKSAFSKPKIFITSDLHLDHTNIIKYCKRPFLNTEEMNRTLINNWNNTVRKKDTVYFLGDLAFGKGSKTTDYWFKQLNGKIIFLKGNHDRSNKIKFYDNYILEYAGIKFFLIHEPEKAPKDWDGWIIYGHHHNNHPDKYPFMDKKNKIINISIELTKYRPVDINEIIEKMNE